IRHRVRTLRRGRARRRALRLLRPLEGRHDAGRLDRGADRRYLGERRSGRGRHGHCERGSGRPARHVRGDDHGFPRRGAASDRIRKGRPERERQDRGSARPERRRRRERGGPGRVRRHRQYVPPREQAVEPGDRGTQRDQRVRDRLEGRAGTHQRPLRTVRLAGRGSVNARPALSARTQHTSLTLAALLAIAAIAWAFLVRGEAVMRSMAGDGPIVELMRVMMRPSESLPYFLAAALMWVVMMIGMMTPAVVPMVMVLRGMNRTTNRERDTLLFTGGYLVGWSVFALVAALLQLWLHTGGLLVGHLLALSGPGGGVILLAAGAYQLTPFK